MPNIAGLIRSSEIMNASSVIINNKNYLENPEFQGISVNAEKWIPIFEVREPDLVKYIQY